ncbi:MAG: hypothetical protein MJ230_04005 [bacterium]|nr:hypothetical protein [bacterium]
MNNINNFNVRDLRFRNQNEGGKAEEVTEVGNSLDNDPMIALMKDFEKGNIDFSNFRKQAEAFGVTVQLAGIKVVTPKYVAVQFEYKGTTYIIQGPVGNDNPNEKSGVLNNNGSSVGADDIKTVCGEIIKGRSITGWGDFLEEIERVKTAIEEIHGDNLEELEDIVNLYENGIWCCKQAINIFGLTQSQLSMVEELDFEFQIERNKAIIEFNTSGLENYEYSPVLYEAYKEAVMGDNTELIESYINAISSCGNVPEGVMVSLEDMEKSLNSKTATGENSIIPTQPNWNGNYVDHLSPQNKIKYQVAINMSSDDDIALRRRLLETFREILTDPCFNNPENAPFKIYLQICCEQLRQFLNNYNRKQSMTVQHEQTAMK